MTILKYKFFKFWLQIPRYMRTVVLIDIDCFYVQVERRQNPDLINKPCAVVQYNPWKGGGIIALSYEAKNAGVTRGMRGEDAKAVCPDIKLVTVPEARGKANLAKYRDESLKILDVLKENCEEIERASIDEAYLELTPLVNKKMNNVQNLMDSHPQKLSLDYISKLISAKDLKIIYEDTCFAPNKSVCSEKGIKEIIKGIGSKSQLTEFVSLIYGALITKHIRDCILTKTGYQCSAGIAENKMLSKLGCGINKPNKQTIVLPANVAKLYEIIPIRKITGLGAKAGEALQGRYKISLMSELAAIPVSKLIADFGEKHGTWLHEISRGKSDEPVKTRLIPKSIGCGKNFPGVRALTTSEKVLHWFTQLSNELLERLAKDYAENSRRPKTLHVTLGQNVNTDTNRVSHQFPFPTHYKDEFDLAQICINNVKKFNDSLNPSVWHPAITNITISAMNLQPVGHGNDKNSADLKAYMQNLDQPSTSSSPRNTLTPSPAKEYPYKSTPSPKRNNATSIKDELKSFLQSSPKPKNILDDEESVIIESIVKGTEPPTLTNKRQSRSPTKAAIEPSTSSKAKEKKALPTKTVSHNNKAQNKTPSKVTNNKKLLLPKFKNGDKCLFTPPEKTPSRRGLHTYSNNLMPSHWNEVDSEVYGSLPDELKWQIDDTLTFKGMKAKQRDQRVKRALAKPSNKSTKSSSQSFLTRSHTPLVKKVAKLDSGTSIKRFLRSKS